MRHLVQIVPELPPATTGVGDYALVLARGLRGLGWQTTFVASREQGGRLLEAHDVLGLSGRDRASALVNAIEQAGTDTVLLQFSGYGYAKRGAPLWLARALRRWKAGRSDRRLVVMFHELWAFGPPWRSSFWVSGQQRAVVRALARLADACFTSTGLYASRLRRLAQHRAPLVVLPVVSNIGEHDEPTPIDDREPLAVIFGRSSMRERAYRHIDAFVPAMRSAGIEAILDIGPPLPERISDRPPLPIIRCGYLAAEAASRAMRRARVGVLDYPLDFAAKSGTFATYAAHALLPLIRSSKGGAHDGLAHGVNLVRTGEPLPDLREAAGPMAEAAHAWYCEHRADRAGACFAQALNACGAVR